MGGNSGDNSGGNSGGNSGSNSGSNGLHAGGPALNPAALQRHLRFTLLTHVFQRTDGIARTSGPDVPTWAHCNAAWDILKELDAAALDRMQDNWNQPGQQSQQSWNPFADVGSTEATNPALNVEGHLPNEYYANAPPPPYHAPHFQAQPAPPPPYTPSSARPPRKGVEK